MDNFNKLILQHVPSLRRFARALTGDASTADALVQTCLEWMLARRKFWRPEINLKIWLYSVIHNVYAEFASQVSSTPTGDAKAADIYAIRVTKDEQLLGRDMGQAIADLPVKQKEAFLLVALEGMKYQDAAQILDVPVGTLLSLIHSARSSIRQQVINAPNEPMRGVK